MSPSEPGSGTGPRFIEHLRHARHDLLRPGLDPADAATALSLLGLDDAALDHWATAAAPLVSLPHASPNVFFPRALVGWFASKLMRGTDQHHIRIALTHVNFSDLGWRPYAWWYLDQAGTLRCHRVFSRNKKRKHVVVASQPALGAQPEGMAGADRRAAQAAAMGADLAASYQLITAVTERAAGLAPAGRTTYLPLTALVSFARELAAERSLPGSGGSDGGTGGSGGAGAWCSALLDGARGRRVGADGALRDCPARDADVFDNYSNLAALCLLGRTCVLGGKKMAGYWPEVRAVIGRYGQSAPGDMTEPEVLVVPEAEGPGPVSPSPAVTAQLAEQGVPYSQAMAVAEHGDFAARYDPFPDD
jgi:hypothetical protein